MDNVFDKLDVDPILHSNIINQNEFKLVNSNKNTNDDINQNLNLKMNTDQIKNFKDLRKFLNDEENLFGTVDKLGVKFMRRYVSNIIDNNVRLYYTNVKTSDTENTKILANLCIAHGFGHHSHEFYELAFFLAQNGINCHLLDYRGHGYSGGLRFDWTIEDLHTDIITLIKQAESDGIDLPLFVFGHSMGGGLVSSLFINNKFLQVNGVILSAPLLGLPQNVIPNALKFFVLSKIANEMREFIFNGNINPSDLCKDEKEMVRILNDKKIIPFANPKSLKSMLKNCQRILQNCQQ
jgi:hypothetical protein